MKRTLIVPAFAKINVGLWVKEKRPDGYHEISSLMQSISLCDTLTIKETREEGIRIDCADPRVPVGKENLVHKAATLLCQELGLPPSLTIRIEKRIPIAAGLAGGSADAAAVMTGLVRMYEKTIPLPELMKLSQKIGSDVPFVMHGGLALATGRGENLEFHEPPRPGFFVVIAIPKGIEVSTRWAYENFQPGNNAKKQEASATIVPLYRAQDLQSLRRVLFNDLESVTFHRHPEVATAKELLNSTLEGAAVMSGSGPSVFGLFHDRKAAAKAAALLDPARFDVLLEHTHKPAQY